jgi:hypothetical protein
LIYYFVLLRVYYYSVERKQARKTKEQEAKNINSKRYKEKVLAGELSKKFAHAL